MRLFHKLLSIRSPTIDGTIVEELRVCPRASHYERRTYDVEIAMRAMANRKVVRSDDLSTVLLKVLVDGEPNTLG